MDDDIKAMLAEIKGLLQSHFESNGFTESDGAHTYDNECAMMYAEGLEAASDIVASYIAK